MKISTKTRYGLRALIHIAEETANDEDKLIGRCLVWKMSDGGTYIDRIYTRHDSDYNLMYNNSNIA